MNQSQDKERHMRQIMANRLSDKMKSNDQLRRECYLMLGTIFDISCSISNDKATEVRNRYASMLNDSNWVDSVINHFNRASGLIFKGDEIQQDRKQRESYESGQIRQIRNEKTVAEALAVDENQKCQVLIQENDGLRSQALGLEIQLNEIQAQLRRRKQFSTYDQETLRKLTDGGWEQETRFIDELCRQRWQKATVRKQAEKALQIFTTKLDKLKDQLAQFQHQTKLNETLKQQNDQLFEQITHQKHRREQLLDIKRQRITSKGIALAQNVTEKWKNEIHESSNLLRYILSKINEQLPAKKIEDIEAIIQDAERFFKNGGRVSLERSQRFGEQENHDQMNLE